MHLGVPARDHQGSTLSSLKANHTKLHSLKPALGVDTSMFRIRSVLSSRHDLSHSGQEEENAAQEDASDPIHPMQAHEIFINAWN